MVHISYSCLVNLPIEEAWKIIGNFEDLSFVNKNIKCKITNYNNNPIHPIRAFQFGPVEIREMLIAMYHDDNHRFLKYNFLQGFEGFKVDNYIATIHAYRITESNQTLVVWEADFDLRKNEEGEKKKLEGLFDATTKMLAKTNRGNTKF